MSRVGKAQQKGNIGQENMTNSDFHVLAGMNKTQCLLKIPISVYIGSGLETLLFISKKVGMKAHKKPLAFLGAVKPARCYSF